MSGKEKDAMDFSLNYDKLRTVLESNPDKMRYEMIKPGFVSVGKAIRDKRWSDLGKYEQVSRIVDVSMDVKRYVEEGPMSGRDILEKQYETEAWGAELLTSLPELPKEE